MKTDIMMMLMSDTYKHTHPRMYPQNLTKLVSYLTPRKNMSPAFPNMVFFGLQAFIKDYLIDGFEKQFFNKPLREVELAYKKYMDIQIGVENTEWDKIKALYELGYLPIEIRALPEGSVVNMGIPVVEMTNTHPDFAWVVQWIECILQAELWAPCAYATVSKAYHDLAKKYYEETTDGADPFMAMADFGMRGMSCMEDSIRASASWLLSFNKTSTIPDLPYIDKYYFARCSLNGIGKGAVSAKKGEKLLIPINMRDGCIVGIGKGNDDWNQSAPHGAGRIMSRSKARDVLTLGEFKKSMDGIFTTSVSFDTIDEAPMAYKPIDEIVENIKDTVDILEIIKPVYNFKASER